VATAHGLPLAAPAPANGKAGGKPAVRTPGRQVRTVPSPNFSPAGTNGGAPAKAGAVDANEWERYTSYIEAEQRGQLEPK